MIEEYRRRLALMRARRGLGDTTAEPQGVTVNIHLGDLLSRVTQPDANGKDELRVRDRIQPSPG